MFTIWYDLAFQPQHRLFTRLAWALSLQVAQARAQEQGAQLAQLRQVHSSRHFPPLILALQDLALQWLLG